MNERTMKRLCEIADGLEELGLVREADIVDAVTRRVVEAQVVDPQVASYQAQLSAISAQQNELLARMSAYNAQKSSLQPSTQAKQDPASNATDLANKQSQLNEIDKQLTLIFQQKGTVDQQEARIKGLLDQATQKAAVKAQGAQQPVSPQPAQRPYGR